MRLRARLRMRLRMRLRVRLRVGVLGKGTVTDKWRPCALLRSVDDKGTVRK